MKEYKYDRLKIIAKKVKLKFLKKGILIKKKIRRKPRDEEKLNLLYKMAIKKLKKYKPKKIDGKIYLPYLKL